MAEVLILVESPNKCAHIKEYAEAAGLKSVQVIGTAGHLFDLPPMDGELGLTPGTWEPTAQVPAGRDDDDRARKQALIERIRKAASEATKVIVASDGDREGEGIASQVWGLIPTEKASRAVFKEITPAGIKAGLASQAQGLNWNLVAAQQARRALDRLAGFYGTNLVFAKLKGHRGSAGRVQSVTTRLVVDRTRAFDEFKAVNTYGVFAKLQADGKEFNARVCDKDGKPLVFNERHEAEAMTLSGMASVLSVVSKERTVKPKPPFTASSWLQVAGKGLKWAVAKATQATQSLFESGSTTYPRTDSVQVSPDAIEWARQEIARRFGPDYVPAVPNEFKDRDGSQGAHEAIRPTIPEHETRKHQAEWNPAFELIEARFFASQAAHQRLSETTATMEKGEYRLIAKGTVELFPGWKKVLSMDAEEEGDAKKKPDEEEEEGGSLPLMKEGQDVQIIGIEVRAFTTKPLPLFTEPALVAELERRGVGRPSTFNAMVTTVISRSYVVECEPIKKGKGKKGEDGLKPLRPSETGYVLTDFLSIAMPEVVDPTWTGKIEDGLDKIEAGTLKKTVFLDTIFRQIQSRVQAADSIPEVRPERKSFGPCPKCQAEGRDGKLVLISGTRPDKTRYEFAACSLDSKENRQCGHTAETLNGELKPAVKCPECNNPMSLIRLKDNAGNRLKCETHGWFTADKAGCLVTPPKCPKCGTAMKFQKKKDAEEWFFACFDHKEFVGADKWGKPEKADKKKGKK